MPTRGFSAASLFAFVGSAALVAAALTFGRHNPWWLGVPVGLFVAGSVWLALRIVARRRMRRMLMTGRAAELLELWGDALGELPHADTTVPLLHATALAASGHTDRARTALSRAAHGTAWPAAQEHRLLVETLLDSFEGERSASLSKAEELRNLPLPAVDSALRARVALLREAVAAVARAFAHEPEDRDAVLLWEAARRNALIHWPLRYAAAVVCIDRGSKEEARRLLADAPEWPEDSAFRAFHAELSAYAGPETRVD
ncbi:MAG: hypothetical protein IPI67_00605 [Myxococcales bacterium]|nr:hypothetical protein [Myxococcales bacterium]